MSDGPHGLRRQPADHSGISGSLPATCFPTASALASSWDPQLVYRVGQAIGAEARARGVTVVLGPGINIKRSPLCGRNFEYFSEDPLLSGAMGTSLVDGIQSQGVGACVKHFTVNNQETDRLRVSADVDERTLREIYLPGFERVVTQAMPWMVMCAYNKINGVYASESRWLLTEVLRREWGFTGVVVSDCGAVHDRVAALAAGLDLEMPPNLGISDTALVAAVREGHLSQELLDQAVLRVLTLAARAGQAGEFDADAHHGLAHATATECAVLLKNQGAILPLRPVAGDIVAVIGDSLGHHAFKVRAAHRSTRPESMCRLTSLRAVPAGVEVAFAAAYGVGTTDADTELAAEAVLLAGRATTVVLFLGLTAADESEGFDRTHMDLPPNRVELLPRLAEVSPNLVVVLSNGSAVRVSHWEHLTIAVTCTITNTGDRAGQEVVQLYVADLDARMARPVRELKAFTKAHLEPGATTTVAFHLSCRDLAYWSPQLHRWVVEGGEFQIAVGASSRDLRLQSTAPQYT